MNKGITNFLMFATGAVIGSLVTWKIVKTKYEQIAREEIDEVRAYYKQKSKAVETSKNIPEEVDVSEYINCVQDMGYSCDQIEEKGVPGTMSRPYVISPEEFDENGYDVVSLTYYADKVLANDMGEIVDDVDGTIGIDSLDHFGEYEDDSVFVRDDELKIDYEILLDPKNYSDLVNSLHPVDE